MTNEIHRKHEAFFSSGSDYTAAISDLRRNQPGALIQRLRAKMPLNDADFIALADWFEGEHKRVGRPMDDRAWQAAYRAKALIANWKHSHPKETATDARRHALTMTACREIEQRYGDPAGSIDPETVAGRMRQAASRWPKVYQRKSSSSADD